MGHEKNWERRLLWSQGDKFRIDVNNPNIGGNGPSVSIGTAGTANTGGGAGRKINPPGVNGDAGFAGGSGIVIIRYRYQ